MVQESLKNQVSYIVSEYKNGRGTSDLGKEFNCNPGTIWSILKNEGVIVKSRSNNYGTLNLRKDEIINLFKEGNSASNIGKLLNISKACILKFLKKNGIDTSFRSTARKDKLVDHTEEIINLYNSGKSSCEIARLFNSSDSGIFKLLNKNNVIFRDDIKYTVDVAFFNIIDNEYKAYILGWLYSDGCVDLKGKIRLQLQIEDKYILEWMAKIMGHDGIIKDIPPPKKFPHRKWQTCLTVNRKELADKLIKLGCMPSKSLILKFPTLDQVPDNLIKHFIRGYFDGDGGISAKGYISITSTDSFLKDLELILKNKLGIEGKTYYRYKDKNTASFMFTKKKYGKKFLEWIYKNSTIHLTRKYEKAKLIMDL